MDSYLSQKLAYGENTRTHQKNFHLIAIHNDGLLHKAITVSVCFSPIDETCAIFNDTTQTNLAIFPPSSVPYIPYIEDRVIKTGRTVPSTYNAYDNFSCGQ